MKTIILVVVLFLAGCTASDMLYTTKTANAMIDLQLEYGRSSMVLDANLDNLPPNAKQELSAIKDRADQLSAEVRGAWRNGQLTYDRLDVFYKQGDSIYSDALKVVGANWDHLTPQSQLAVKQIQILAAQVDASYKQARSEQESSQLLEAGVEMATLALRLGLVLL